MKFLKFKDVAVILMLVCLLLFPAMPVHGCGGYGMGFGGFSYYPAASYGYSYVPQSYAVPQASAVTSVTTTTVTTPTIVLPPASSAVTTTTYGAAGYGAGIAEAYGAVPTTTLTTYAQPTTASIYSYSAYPTAYRFQPFALYGGGYGGYSGFRTVGSFNGFHHRGGVLNNGHHHHGGVLNNGHHHHNNAFNNNNRGGFASLNIRVGRR